MHSWVVFRRACRFLGIVAGTVCMASFAQADFFSGNNLIDSCGIKNDFVGGYVAGVVDTVGSVQSTAMDYISNPDNDAVAASGLFAVVLNKIGPFCAPKGMNVAQARAVFCKYLRENPKERHKSAATLVVQSLVEAFPCKRSKP